MTFSEQVQPSHHVCFLYNTHADFLAQTIQFCLDGLQHNHKVVCHFVGDTSAELCRQVVGVSLPVNYNFVSTNEVITGLEREGIDVHAYLSGGQLLLQSEHSSYSENAVFDPRKALATYRFLMTTSRLDGFSGIRILADMAFVLGYLGLSRVEQLFEFESKLNLLHKEFPEFIGMCCFDTALFSSLLQKEAMQTHPIVACQNMYCKNNFYYVPPEKYLNANPTSSWLKNLDDRTQAETRLENTRSEMRQQIYDLNRALESNNVLSTKELFAQELNRQKQSLLSNISHEIRTPLTGILGGIDLLKSTTVSREQQEYLDFLVPSVRHLSHVLASILELDQEVVLRLSPTNLSSIIQFAIDDAKSITVGNRSEMQIAYTISDDVPELVVADDQRVKGILVNIISNSIKFSQFDCKIHITTDVIEKEEKVIKLGFKIVDNGIGIISGGSTSVFDTFWQNDQSSSKRYAGMGLGLAVTKSFITAMGGQISVSSEGLGTGTTVEFTIDVRVLETYDSTYSPLSGLSSSHSFDVQYPTSPPILSNLQRAFSSPSLQCTLLPTSPEIRSISQPLLSTSVVSLPKISLSQDTPPREPATEAKHPWRNKPSKFIALSAETVPESMISIPSVPKRISILLVEDNIINAKIIIQLLAKLGYVPDLARNGVEAVTATKEKEYDLIFMDLHMPIMDGFQATEEILNTSLTDPPLIVALTASVSELDKRKCERAGMVGHLSKPVSSLALQEILLSVT